jgi:dihydroflavonol-4-reductase
MPAYINTGLNVVGVEDVAKGHILALERGRIGERYILGGRNLTLRDILDILEHITGIPAPRLRIPIWLALGAAYANEFISGRMMKRCPRIPVAGVKAASRFRYFDCSKADSELGFPKTAPEEALKKAVRWFEQNGYVR